MDITELRHGALLTGHNIDATANRERKRQRRLWKIVVTLGLPLAYVWGRELAGAPVHPGLPPIISGNPAMVMLVVLLGAIGAMMVVPMLVASRSPHTIVHPADSATRLADVVGADETRREAIDTLNLFLNHETFANELGGSPRRGVLFEGAPGTGKTYLAKAMAAEAGVPFLFVSASEFQSPYFGTTNRKLRAFFKALRKAARRDGGAIGFIEEFDAIGGSRSGMGGSGSKEGMVGIVNELLVQMQSFDLPTGWQKWKSKQIDRVNSLLPDAMRLRSPRISRANILIIAATNRAADLDPALLRPGRFDRQIHFDLPPRNDREKIAQYYLDRKSHTEAVTSGFIADISAGYTPVRIERLLDEALIVAVRNGRRALTLDDIVEAQLVTEIGLSHEVGYHPEERHRVAIHEAGHALTAALFGREIRIASILRRGAALGLVSHGDPEERHLKTPSEAGDMMVIALAGRAAEIQELGEASSGIASDLAVATTMAAQLVGQLGAGTSLVSLEAADMPLAGNLVAKALADTDCRRQVESLMHQAAERAQCLVLEHRIAMMSIASALLERDELTGSEVHEIVGEAIRRAAAA